MANFFGKLFKKKDSGSASPRADTGSHSPSPSPAGSANPSAPQKRFDILDNEPGTPDAAQRRGSTSGSAAGSAVGSANGAGAGSGSGAGSKKSVSPANSQSNKKRNSPRSSPKESPLPQSEFARSAHEAARRGLKAPAREIDENTALSSLTDAEIVRLMEGMEGDVLRQPLITGPVPLLAIKKEYLRGSPQVLRKLEWLEANGWDQVWRARGDGDCFYRSFTLAFLLRILYAPDPSGDAARALTAVHATLPSMERSGFQTDLLDEFLEPLLSVIASFVDPPPGQEPTEYSLLQVLQNPEKSNCIVVALRLITGAYIRTHPDDFAPFLFSPVTMEPVTPDVFCAQEVEPCGREADNAQIMALAAALQMPVRVAYLDRSEAGSGVINWVEFEHAEEENRPLTLLYRPGHFDVVAKDKLQAALVQSQKDAQDAQAAAVCADAAEVFAPKSQLSNSAPVAGPSRQAAPEKELAAEPQNPENPENAASSKPEHKPELAPIMNGKGKGRQVDPPLPSPVKVRDFATMAPPDTDTRPPPMPEDVFVSEPESPSATPSARTSPLKPLSGSGPGPQLDRVDAELAKSTELDETAERGRTAEGGAGHSGVATEAIEKENKDTAESKTSQPTSPTSPSRSPFGNTQFIQPRAKRSLSPPPVPAPPGGSATEPTTATAAVATATNTAAHPAAETTTDVLDSDEEKKTPGTP